ncbi:MAG TPA: tetratricopeptide repeat protein [Thiobacillaceae bacterium]|nr:tetratricopeptide repeat protein [Thiobacillaceae bacterium]
MPPVTHYALAAAITLCLASGAIAQVSKSIADSHHAYHAASHSASAPSRPNWIRQAIAHEQRRDWQGLMDLGRHWTAAEPGNASAWFVLGRALGQMNRYTEAISAYLKDLEIEPRDLNGRNNLGNAYRDSGRFPEAMRAYRDAVRINPDYIPAWYNLALTFYQLKGMVGVSQALQQLRTVDPKLADAWSKLAIQYLQTHDERVAQEAVKVLHGLNSVSRERMFGILLAGV